MFGNHDNEFLVDRKFDENKNPTLEIFGSGTTWYKRKQAFIYIEMAYSYLVEKEGIQFVLVEKLIMVGLNRKKIMKTKFSSFLNGIYRHVRSK